MRRCWVLLAGAVLLAGCGGDGDKASGTPTPKPVTIIAADLQRHGAPLVTAHDALLSFSDKVDSGYSNGDVIREWPNVSAEVKKQLRAYDAQTWPPGWATDDEIDMTVFRDNIAKANEAWTKVHSAVRTYVNTQGTQSLSGVIQANAEADVAMKLAALARESALVPGRVTPTPIAAR